MQRIARVFLYGGSAGLVVVIAWVHARFIGEYALTDSGRFAWTLVYIGLIWLTTYSVGLPEHEERGASLRAALLAALFAPALFSLVQSAAGNALLPRFVVAASVLPLFLLFASCGWLHRRTKAVAAERDAVLAVIDSTVDGDDLRADVEASVIQPSVLKAIMSPAEVTSAGGLEHSLRELGANMIVLDRSALQNEKLLAEASVLHQHGLRVRSVFDYYEEWIGKIPLRELELSVLMFDIAEVHQPSYRRTSRLVDVVFGALGLVVLLVAIPFVSIGNLIGNRGPLLYRQPRVGRDGMTFDILKFRSMTVSSAASEWTKDNDARITPFGKVLRLSHLDELPQVINILRGHLSIVGPRPEQPRYVDELTEKIPFYQLRHLVRPGLTGWAQVNYPYGANEQDALEKLQFEFWYLRHQSVWLDLSIVAKTLRHVVGMRGR